MAARIRDVAVRAGVGVGTVSRVLNDVAGVRPQTRSRVEEAISELGYRPDPRARALSLGRSHSVGAVVPFFTHPSAVERMRGVVQALRDSDYDLVLCDVETDAARARPFTSLIAAERADGLLLVSLAPTDEEVGHYRAARKPVVLVDCEHPALPSVVTDDVAGGRLAAEHLLALGHERIAFVGDAPDPAGRFVASSRRLAGFDGALAAAGHGPCPEHVLELSAHTQGAAREAAFALLQGPGPPTAIFAAADTLALGVLEAATATGLAVPDAVSVIGFDDLDVAGHVGLSTIRQPLQDSGRSGGELLLRALRGLPATPRRTELALSVVPRRTTGRVRAYG